MIKSKRNRSNEKMFQGAASWYNAAGSFKEHSPNKEYKLK